MLELHHIGLIQAVAIVVVLVLAAAYWRGGGRATAAAEVPAPTQVIAPETEPAPVEELIAESESFTPADAPVPVPIDVLEPEPVYEPEPEPIYEPEPVYELEPEPVYEPEPEPAFVEIDLSDYSHANDEAMLDSLHSVQSFPGETTLEDMPRGHFMGTTTIKVQGSSPPSQDYFVYVIKRGSEVLVLSLEDAPSFVVMNFMQPNELIFVDSTQKPLEILDVRSASSITVKDLRRVAHSPEYSDEIKKYFLDGRNRAALQAAYEQSTKPAVNFSEVPLLWSSGI